MIGDEQAKAAQEIAKLGQKSVDAASEAGGFLAKTFGKAIDQISEAMADKAAGYRIRNRANVIAKTRTHLEQLGVTDFKAIDFRNAVPLLEGISDESDDSLQDVWAAYFANALDPKNETVKANRQFIDIIRHLEPEDLPVLQRLSLKELSEVRGAALTLTIPDFPIDEAVLIESLARMAALGLFSFDNGPPLLALDTSQKGRPCRISIETSIGEFSTLPLLMYLQNAIHKPGK